MTGETEKSNMAVSGWKPMAPTVTINKGDFSFLIAFAKQLDRALELCYDGSAPDFLVDTVGVLANGLEGLSGSPVDPESNGGGADESDDDDLSETRWVPPSVEDGNTRQRDRSRAVDGSIPGTRSGAGMTTGAVMMRRVAPPQPVPRGTRGTPKKKVSRGKKSSRK